MRQFHVQKRGMHMKRLFLIVLDSVGIGELPDAANYGDVGSNTLKSASKSSSFNGMPNMRRLGYFNIDATIIAQQPKMRPHIEKMEENIAGALGIDVNQVNIKATTEEGLGFTGSGEGISAQAICMIQSVYEGAVTVADSEGTGRCQGCAGCSRA